QEDDTAQERSSYPFNLNRSAELFCSDFALIKAKLPTNAAGILHVRTLPAAHVLTGRKSIIRSFTVAAASAAVLALSATAFAADHGTADEAKAMLMKAVVALKADKAKTLDQIDKGEGGFLDRDLYVFCGNPSDGKTVLGSATIWAVASAITSSSQPHSGSPHTNQREQQFGCGKRYHTWPKPMRTLA